MHILISGAGIAGPTLAWFLAKSDHEVTIVEKAKSFLGQGQNIDLKGAAVKVVRKMGVLEEIRRWNTTEVGTRFVDTNNRSFANFPLGPGGFSPTSEHEILRGDLANIFYSATKDNPKIKYLFSTTIRNVLSNDDDAVKVEFSTGETRTFDLAVAADGAWSELRKRAIPAEWVNYHDFRMHTAYFTIPRRPTDEDWWEVHMALKARVLSIRPDPHGTMRAMISQMPRTDADHKEWLAAARSDRQTQEDLIRREFADAGGQAPRFLDAMSAATDFHLAPLQQVRMTRWSHARVVCLGDAAYAPTPLTGMGTPLAIIGAYILAGELNQLAPGANPTTALQAYEKAYRPFVEKVQQVPSFVPKIAHPTSKVRRWMVESFVATVATFIAVIVPLFFRGYDTAEENDDGFVLPEYGTLDEKISKS